MNEFLVNYLDIHCNRQEVTVKTDTAHDAEMYLLLNTPDASDVTHVVAMNAAA